MSASPASSGPSPAWPRASAWPGLAWLACILYADAIIAPVGTGLIYTTTTSRITFGMSKNGHVPSIFEKTTKKSNVPIFGLIFTFLMGL
jgi:amino acid transporter